MSITRALCAACVILMPAAAPHSYAAEADSPAVSPPASKPTLFLTGDSTVHNRTRGQLGWGDVLADWFDSAKINVTNRALGGRSSRTFMTEGLWDKVLSALNPGDFVLMQFGHNDGGPLDDGRARASLKGSGDDSRVVTNKVSGKVETVHTYGWYLRKYITDTKAKGATPIVLSLVPRKIWRDGKIVRASNDYGKWAADAAKLEGVAFVDLNHIVACRYESLGEEKVSDLFADEHTHTTEEGARLNAQSVVEGLRALEHCTLAAYLAPEPRPHSASGTPPTLDYAIGADLSFLKQAEAGGTTFKEQGQPKPGLQIFKDHGYNWIRLRLFHSPTRLPNNLDYTIALAREAKALGFKFLLDFHYSDTWADPGKQFIPKAWAGKSHSELVQAVFDYSRDTLFALRQAGVPPDMVQVGNEITHGMLWPDGKLPEQWDNFAELVKAGIAGVQAGSTNSRPPLIMIHIDRGGDLKGTKWFFDKLKSYGLAYDVIGQSYYPWWHGSPADLQTNLAFMADTYNKDIVIVEAAYNWRSAEYRNKPAPFPETPEGQQAFLREVDRLVRATPHQRGRGVFWWEPAVAGGLRSRGMFGENGNALPVITVFDRPTGK
jgi:arabinogalactan endo-1,4-beta-galactosidase